MPLLQKLGICEEAEKQVRDQALASGWQPLLIQQSKEMEFPSLDNLFFLEEYRKVFSFANHC